MELIAAAVLAGPLGYVFRNRRLGLGLNLIAFAVVFPFQTVVVHGDNADDINPSYFVVNAVILAIGLGVNILGTRLRQRRTRDRVRSPASD